MGMLRCFVKVRCPCKYIRIFCRTYKSDSNDFPNEEFVEEEENKYKGKISVTRKIFYKDSPTKSTKILEAKDASSVIKSLNWEFKMLYGAIRSSTSSPVKEKTFESNIIQHQTVIPFLDPKDESKPAQNIDSDISNEINCWQTLLKFPLLNKQSPMLSSDLEISEINSLRKVLEEKSKSYIPSVSRILQKTMPQEQSENLRRWKENMIQELGEEGFQKYQEGIK